MDVQAASGAGPGAGAGVVQPERRVRGRQGPEDLRAAQPVMGQGAQLPVLPDVDPDMLLTVLEVDGDIVVRRRASSSGESGVQEAKGWREMAFVRQLAKDIRRENEAGVNKAGRELRKLGYEGWVIDELIARHDGYRRILRALAGGNVRASDAQRAQAFALSVFDVNRLAVMREMMEVAKPTDTSSANFRSQDMLPLRLMVAGAKRLTEFDDLRPMVELWIHLRLDTQGPERPVLALSLAQSTGLFHTNVRRLMNAYEEAASAGRNIELLQRLPSCLAKQWMSGCSERERDALRGASGELCAEFHRKLNQQYALLCRCFGLPLPAMAELLLIDADDQGLS